MTFRSLARDLRDSIGSLSRRSFNVRLHSGKSRGAFHELHGQPDVIQTSCWAALPPELLRAVIKKLEESESTWPARKSVVSCASVCRSWRVICKEIVQSPEFCGKLTFPLSLKQPGYRDGTIQCFIKKDKSKMTYQLFLCLGPDFLAENGKFLLSAKKFRRIFCTEFVISTDADDISRSSSSYIGKVRTNPLGPNCTIYETHNSSSISATAASRRFFSKKVSPKVPSGSSYKTAQVFLASHCCHFLLCAMRSIPVSSVEPGGAVPELHPRSIDDSFRRVSFSSSEQSFGISIQGCGPLFLRNKLPRWDQQSQSWSCEFDEEATHALCYKNFQLVVWDPSVPPGPSQQNQSDNNEDEEEDDDEFILQFVKVGKGLSRMDYRYPLSAFQAFAICLCKSNWKPPPQQ